MNPLGGSHDAGINTSHIAASLGRTETCNSPEKPLVSLGITAEESNSTVTLTSILNTKKGCFIIMPYVSQIVLESYLPRLTSADVNVASQVPHISSAFRQRGKGKSNLEQGERGPAS